MIVIAGHKVPLNGTKRAHIFDRPCERLLGHLLLFVDISGNENRGSPRFDGGLPEIAHNSLTRILQDVCDLVLEIPKCFANLEIGRMDKLHCCPSTLNFSCRRFSTYRWNWGSARRSGRPLHAYWARTQMTALPSYGGMRLPLAIGAVVLGEPSTFQTPLSGQVSPVRAFVPMGARFVAVILI